MFDAHLAMLYGLRTKAQALFRNKGRFPEDFAVQLTKEEFDHLRSQIVTSSIRPKAGSLFLVAVGKRFG
jgi:hypothetical protein